MRSGTSLSPDSPPASTRPAGTSEVLPLDLGDGVVLHATVEQDAIEAFAVVDRERDRLREWLPWVDATVDEGVERDYLRSVEAANAAGIGLHATIRCRGEFCGFVGLRLSPVHSTAEVGYWLSERCVGKGQMTRAVAALFEVAFVDLRLHRVELLAATENRRSRAIAQRLGMTLEGVRREAEELASGFVDLAMYSLLAQDWQASAGAARSN
jgi:ribosomal-protein-serine acetyltransferase